MVKHLTTRVGGTTFWNFFGGDRFLDIKISKIVRLGGYLEILVSNFTDGGGDYFALDTAF